MTLMNIGISVLNKEIVYQIYNITDIIFLDFVILTWYKSVANLKDGLFKKKIKYFSLTA